MPKVSETEKFLHPEVWTCEKVFSGGVEKYWCFMLLLGYFVLFQIRLRGSG